MIETGGAKYDFTVEWTIDAEGASAEAEYALECFDAASAERLLQWYLLFLENAALAPDTAVGVVPLLDSAEEEKITRDWNQTEAAFPVAACLHHLFERRARDNPEALALTGNGFDWTYGELEQRSNQLAHCLQIGRAHV